MTSSTPSSSGEGSNAYEHSAELSDDRDALERFHADFFGQVEVCGYDEAAAFAVRLALEEAMANAFRHGNQGDATKRVTIHYTVNHLEVLTSVRDEGSGFDPHAVPDPTLDSNLEIPSGRGIMLMRAYMSHVEIIPPGNRLDMRFIRPA
jgi:serine/threonine-protein kinase RsbW